MEHKFQVDTLNSTTDTRMWSYWNACFELSNWISWEICWVVVINPDGNGLDGKSSRTCNCKFSHNFLLHAHQMTVIWIWIQSTYLYPKPQKYLSPHLNRCAFKLIDEIILTLSYQPRNKLPLIKHYSILQHPFNSSTKKQPTVRGFMKTRLRIDFICLFYLIRIERKNARDKFT